MTASDFATTTVTVTGLKQAAENLMNIGSGELRTLIARDSARAAAWVIGDAVKDRTYTTFQKQTGWIKSGIGVRVAMGVRNNVLNSVIGEMPQYAGSFNPAAALFRQHHHGRAHHKAPALAEVAFWWRFLEFGTHERHRKSTPKFLYKPPPKRQLTKRRLASRALKLGAWHASASRGGISGRQWVRPAFAASQLKAVEQYEATMRNRTEEEVNNLPT
jgi:hypothetical protein